MDDCITRREHEEYARRMEDEHHRQNRRISKLEEEVKENNKLVIAVEKMAQTMEAMLKEQKDQGERLEVLESRDGEKWRDTSKYIITLIIGAVVGYIFTQLGM